MQGFEKGYSRFARERKLETEQKLKYFDPPSYGRQRCVFLVSWCSTGGPGFHSTGYWLSLLHLISIFSGPQLIRAPSPFGRGCGLSITPTPTVTGTRTVLTSVLTELYNISTPTRSPTRSVEWHDWSSSSGNNCHAVHRSLSSGASVYECIMGFTLSHFISQIHPCDLFRLLAIGTCPFFPVHHFVMAFLAGSKGKIQHQDHSGPELKHIIWLNRNLWHLNCVQMKTELFEIDQLFNI